jgi:hypothetical protein
MIVKNRSMPGCSLYPKKVAVSGPSTRYSQEEFGEDLIVARGDIEFFDVTRECVCVRIKVHNISDRQAPSQSIEVSSAQLGAFLPWRHLDTLEVPSLMPGGMVVVETAVKRFRPLPLGPIDRVPPGALLTALKEDDDANKRSGFNQLAASILDYVNSRDSYWVGNINVFVKNHSVERHHAPALRVQPGKLNIACFRVGNANLSDEYAFRILGDGINWESRLFTSPLSRRSLVRSSESMEIEENCWVPASRSRIVYLKFCPPEDACRGKIDVEVTQRSTGRKVLVEFSLDAGADGPGCYVI